MSSLHRLSLLLLSFVVLTACATTPTAETAPRPSSDRISQQEIMQTDVSNAYELIERLRPNWLLERGRPSFVTGTQGILVYEEQQRLGGIESLRQIRVTNIHSIRYLDGATATSTLPGIGSGHVAGAIVINTRPDRDSRR